MAAAMQGAGDAAAAGLDLNAVCSRFLPLVAEYESWPAGKVEHLMATGEAMSMGLVLAKLMQDRGLSEAELEASIASGEVPALLRAVASAASPDADPTPRLMEAIYAGRPVLRELLSALEPHLFDDSRGFAVDLASGAAFLAQSFARRWPKLKWYPSEHSVEKGAMVGMGFMEWSLRQFAESPDRDFEDLARRDRLGAASSSSSASAREVQLNLLDTVWYPSAPPWPSAEEDARPSLALWDRASDVDVGADEWPELEHLFGACRAVTCSGLLARVGYRDPELWQSLVRNGARLLTDGGIMLLHDTTEWGGYLDRSTMERFLRSAALPLELVEHRELGAAPPHGRMALEVLRWIPTPGAAAAQRDAELGRWAEGALRVAARLRERGNECFKPGRSRCVPTAVRCYTKALDALSVAGLRGSGAAQRQEMASRLESNLSAALLEAHRAEEALGAADRCIHWEPEWPKGHFRRIRALEALGRLEELLAARAVFGQLTEAASGAGSAESPALGGARAPAAEEEATQEAAEESQAVADVAAVAAPAAAAGAAEAFSSPDPPAPSSAPAAVPAGGGLAALAAPLLRCLPCA